MTKQQRPKIKRAKVASKKKADRKAIVGKEEGKMDDKVKGVAPMKNTPQSIKEVSNTEAKKHEGNANPKAVEQKKAKDQQK